MLSVTLPLASKCTDSRKMSTVARFPAWVPLQYIYLMLDGQHKLMIKELFRSIGSLSKVSLKYFKKEGKTKRCQCFEFATRSKSPFSPDSPTHLPLLLLGRVRTDSVKMIHSTDVLQRVQICLWTKLSTAPLSERHRWSENGRKDIFVHLPKSGYEVLCALCALCAGVSYQLPGKVVNYKLNPDNSEVSESRQNCDEPWR